MSSSGSRRLLGEFKRWQRAAAKLAAFYGVSVDVIIAAAQKEAAAGDHWPKDYAFERGMAKLAYRAWHKGRLTDKDARLLGCNV